MNDNIKKIQDALMNEISRLADDNIMSADNSKLEVARANAIAGTSSVYLKTINLKLSAMNASSKLDVGIEQVFETVGINYEK